MLLFLVLLLSSTASSYLHHSGKLFRNPQKFVSTFSQANPDTIKNLIDKLDELLAQGVSDLGAATTNHNEKSKAFDEQDTLLTKAKKVNTSMTSKLKNSTEALQKADDELKAQNKVLAKAVEDRDLHFGRLQQVTTVRDLTVEKTNNEINDFKEILELLKGLVPTQQDSGRRLLETAEGDVDKIKDFLKQMQDEAVEEAAAAEKAVTLAKAENASATAAYETETRNHINLSEERGQAQRDFDRDALLLASAVDAVKEIQKKWNQAKVELEAAKELLDNETKRIESDTKTLNQVKEVLSGLLQ